MVKKIQYSVYMYISMNRVIPIDYCNNNLVSNTFLCAALILCILFE